MKSVNKNTIIASIISLLAGFTLAYILFGSGTSKTEETSLESSHNHQAAGNDSIEAVWTCSMHPQIRQNEPGNCPICGMDLIPLQENASKDSLVLEMTEAAVQLSNIQTTTVGGSSGKSGKGIRLSGKVQADERLASSQVAHVPGRVEKLYISFTGEQVRKGQKLADIYSPDLITAQQELLEAKKLKAINPGLEEAARNKLKYWKISQATIQSIIDSGKIRETFPLFADASGIVTTRRISVGDYVKQGESLFDLMNLDKVWVLFDVYEEDLSQIHLGDRIEFSTPSIPNKTFNANIRFIDPIINSGSRTVSIRVELNNYDRMLKPEMLVYGKLIQKNRKDIRVIVPKSAVLWTGARSVAYVKVPEMEIPSFEYREIELGESLGDSYEILSGLEPGDELVTYGNFAIDAAAQLNNQASMMNKRVNVGDQGKGPSLPDFTELTTTAFKDQLFSLTEAYLQLKDAFVATDPELAAKESTKLLTSLDEVDMSLLKGKAHMYWMDQFTAIQAHGKKIAALTDVEEQRKQFDFLSEALIQAIKAFGIPKDTFYIQHCPMAIGKEGADWISDQTAIRNPYFGDQMLKCGAVTDTISREYKNPMHSN